MGLKTFRHGVHPPESKDETAGMPIRQFPFAPLLIVPLVQHIGKPSVPVVHEGQEVVRGQRIDVCFEPEFDVVPLEDLKQRVLQQLVFDDEPELRGGEL